MRTVSKFAFVAWSVLVSCSQSRLQVEKDFPQGQCEIVADSQADWSRNACTGERFKFARRGYSKRIFAASDATPEVVRTGLGMLAEILEMHENGGEVPTLYGLPANPGEENYMQAADYVLISDEDTGVGVFFSTGRDGVVVIQFEGRLYRDYVVF